MRGVLNKDNRIPFLIMSDYMNHPNLLWLEARKVLKAQCKYLEGKYQESFDEAEAILLKTKDIEITKACLAGQVLCSLYMGNSKLWLAKRKKLGAIPPRNKDHPMEKELVMFSLEAAIGIPTKCPDWLFEGQFYGLKLEHIPFAITEYMIAHMFSPKGKEHNPKLHESLCAVCDSIGIKTSSVYMHLLEAACYHDIGDLKNCKKHISCACEIAIPNRWLAPLVEMRRFIGVTLDNIIKDHDSKLFEEYKALYNTYEKSWYKIYEELEKIHPFNDLTVREIEIAKYAAIGLSNKEISSILHISPNTVKGSMANILIKANLSTRKDLATYLNM